MKNFIDFYKSLDPNFKQVSSFLFLTYFFVLFSYPLVRSATGAIFYEAYTSADYSFATFIGVIALMVIIGINNTLQARFGIHKIYFFTGIFSVVIFLVSYSLYKLGIKEMAYVLFAAKESYIVLLIHMSLAFGNSYYSLDQVKRLFGPLGAAGSIGGIIGGQLTSVLATSWGTEAVLYLALVIIVFAVFAFNKTNIKNPQKLEVQKIAKKENEKNVSPLEAIKDVRKYVALIASVVVLSQFVIFIGDLQFNIIFAEVVTLKDERTAYLGRFYSYINVFSLFIQFVILPYALVRLSNRSIFFSIPIIFFILIIGGMNFGIGSLPIIAGVFIGLKGIDYSLFAVAKEVMYHPLQSLQKYGAKYITDMFIYRLSKALIAFFMSQYAIENLKILGFMQFAFLLLWIICIIFLFKEDKKLRSKNESTIREIQP